MVLMTAEPRLAKAAVSTSARSSRLPKTCRTPSAIWVRSRLPGPVLFVAADGVRRIAMSPSPEAR